MNVPSRDQTEEWRRQLYRAIEEFDRLSSELFGPTEVVYRIPHSNGLGVWIGVKSVRKATLGNCPPLDFWRIRGGGTLDR